ncbi:DUF421 domain-containing protein [Aurantiacibacter spongiae]|nr:YetF domain-containing protein [Aurantiacibacter spongiae]
MNESIDTWFNGLDRLESVAISAVVFYFLIILMTRLAGKRTTGQMNNFDWIVTVAVGSLAASGILLKDVSIADAALSIVILFALQWLVTWFVLRSDIVCRLIKARPRLLLDNGRIKQEAMRQERISQAEIYAVLREQGFARLTDANWVILENDGKMTVIPHSDTPLEDAELMSDVARDSEAK